MKRNFSITIGIPAYNEKKSIVRLLLSLFDQKQDTFTIEKILVVSDGSTDGMEKVIKSLENNKIKIFQNKKRKGQIFCQNLIFSKSNTDIVILLEADTIPSHNMYLSQLLKPLQKNKKVGLVQGSYIPFNGKNMLEKTLESQFNAFQTAARNHHAAKDWLCSGRGGRAFSKVVYKNLIWPGSVPEDVYALLWCKSKKIKVDFNNNAVCFFRCPTNVKDFLKEKQKFKSGKYSIERYFIKDLVHKNYSVPLSVYFNTAKELFYRSPVHFMVYFYLFVYSFVKTTNQQFTDFWDITYSTKII